jgi:hypothetical protein
MNARNKAESAQEEDEDAKWEIESIFWRASV